MARTFTREEFHALVWSKPMTHLAKEFAMSDVALHKICRKHDVPNPPLGWWAKKAAGQKVKEIALPRAKAGIADRITIAGGDLSRESPALSEVREQARVAASAVPSGDPAAPHPIITRTVEKLRKAKPSRTGLASSGGKGVIRCEVAYASIDRLAEFLPVLVQAAGLQGFSLTGGEDAACFSGKEEVIGFSVTEQTIREKHVLTEAEQAEEDKWRRKRDRESARGSLDWRFTFERPRCAEWDYRPSGKLSVEFEQVYVWGGSSPRRSFRDAKVQRLENMASDIAVGLAVIAAAKTEQRLRREAEAVRAAEELRRREEAARRHFVEERRLKSLEAMLAEFEGLDRLRRLIAIASADGGGEDHPRLREFVAWANQHLASREAALQPDGIERRFDKERIFGDTDDEGFRFSRW